jgi:hypothetical protein
MGDIPYGRIRLILLRRTPAPRSGCARSRGSRRGFSRSCYRFNRIVGHQAFLAPCPACLQGLDRLPLRRSRRLQALGAANGVACCTEGWACRHTGVTRTRPWLEPPARARLTSQARVQRRCAGCSRCGRAPPAPRYQATAEASPARRRHRSGAAAPTSRLHSPAPRRSASRSSGWRAADVRVDLLPLRIAERRTVSLGELLEVQPRDRGLRPDQHLRVAVLADDVGVDVVRVDAEVLAEQPTKRAVSRVVPDPRRACAARRSRLQTAPPDGS